jgi:hypothetical protein
MPQRDQIGATPPLEVFPQWDLAQLEMEDMAREPLIAPHVLRAQGFLPLERAKRISDWYTTRSAVPTDAALRSYRALERETWRLFDRIHQGLGVQVRYLEGDHEPYGSAAEMCATLRGSRSMTLLRDEPHPVLGGIVHQLRVVHDVFGHAALGLGFDLQSEFATWLQCRALFSPEARPAAFSELVGAVTAFVMTGEKPGLHAKLPPAELVLDRVG